MGTLNFAVLLSFYFNFLSILLLHNSLLVLCAWTSLNNSFMQIQDSKCLQLTEGKSQRCLLAWVFQCVDVKAHSGS